MISKIINGQEEVVSGSIAEDLSTTTLNDNPLSFTTDSEQAARECVITFEVKQAGSGDPSPTNIRLISGYDVFELVAANGADPTAQDYTALTDISETLPETLYGGTLNVETGELTVNCKRVDLGSLTWDYNSTSQIFYADASGKKLGKTDAFIICDIFKTRTDYTVDMENYSIGGNQNNARFYIKDTDYNTASALTTAVTGKYAVYELATPYTIHLTPAQVRLLQGNNVVTTNGTNIKLTYRNGELATLEDLSSVAESVNGLGEYVAANKAGDAVDLTSYNAGTNKFSFPCDGYVYINGRNNTSGYIRVYIFPKGGKTVIAPISINITAVQQMQSVFVRKGMLCYVNTSIADVSTIIAQFKPLT